VGVVVSNPAAVFVRRSSASPLAGFAAHLPRYFQRVFDINLQTCPHWVGPLKIIAAIQNPSAITRILAHLGLPTRAPPKAPARFFDHFATT
jgi:hypothetical protein